VLGKDHRCSKCGQKALGAGASVSLHLSKTGAHFSGVETCSSVWLCPVCAVKITEKRRVGIDEVLKDHFADGGSAYMGTFTIPHRQNQRCADLRAGVAAGWRKATSGKAWKDARQRFGCIGTVRAMEVTHGANGWHPHLHVLVFLGPNINEEMAALLGEWLFEQWARAIARIGLGECSRDAFAWERCREDRGAADYVGKWGAALELTKAHMKRGRYGRTPWQIIADYDANGLARDARLIREYADAFNGARQLTWSRELGARYRAVVDLKDEELAAEESSAATQIAAMHRDVFHAVAARQKTAEVLLAMETGGLSAVLDLLTYLRIPWGLTEVPGFEPGTFVPCIARGSPGDTSWGGPGDLSPNRENKGFLRCRGFHERSNEDE
jgi:hypothetical protein